MNKKILIITVLILCLAISMAGCGGSKEEAVKLFDYDLSQYVTLGEYKGLKANNSIDTNTWFDIRRELINAGEAEEFNDGVIEAGDMANIDFVGSKDGVPFEGGSAEGLDLLIGSGEFIPGFEEGLMGVKIGDSVVLDLTFPENYHAEDLAGQAVEFEVTVNFVKRPEPKAFTKELLWELTKRNSVIIDYPAKEIDETIASIAQYYMDYAAQIGMTWEDFLVQAGTTQEQVDTLMQNMAQQKVSGDMIACAIARAEGLSVSDKEFKDGVAEFMAARGYDTEKAFKDANGGKTFEQVVGRSNIELSLLYDKVMEFIYSNAIF